MRNGIEARLAAAVLAWLLSALIFTAASFQARADERLSLPGWIWAAAPYGRPPAAAIGPAGEMIFTSNVVPTLWRVDPRTFAVSVHELALDADTDKDVGFSALVYSPRHGAYFAVSQEQGSIWLIDRDLAAAHKVGVVSRDAACADLASTVSRRVVAGRR